MPEARAGGPDTITLKRNYPVLLRRMERLMDISRTLTSTLELAPLLQRIIHSAAELLDTEAASIMLFDPQSGELRFEATTNLEARDMEGIGVPLEGSIAGWIVKNAQPLVVPDTTLDNRWSNTVDQQTTFVTRSILGVPLFTRDKILGVLEAVNKCGGRFTDEDVSLLQTLAAQAAVAIVNARLFQQSDLISEMVHELRAPLTSLTAISHLLLRPGLPEDKHADLVKTLQRETGRLAQMTTDFLDMARLESGRVRFARENFDLAALLQECLEVVREQATTRGLTLSLQVSPMPALESDRGKIKQVVLNFLTNAVKYNRDNGTITVTAFVHAGDGIFRVSVADTGRGIPPEAMPHMFEKFYRVPDSESQVSGTGLGLPIAKTIVEALGGEMGVTSTVGTGSTFYFTLPGRPGGG